MPRTLNRNRRRCVLLPRRKMRSLIRNSRKISSRLTQILRRHARRLWPSAGSDGSSPAGFGLRGIFFILSAADIKRTIKFNSLHKNIIVQKTKLLIAHIQPEM